MKTKINPNNNCKQWLKLSLILVIALAIELALAQAVSAF